MNKFIMAHPWMTFFLVSSAIAGAVTIIRGRDPFFAKLAAETES